MSVSLLQENRSLSILEFPSFQSIIWKHMLLLSDFFKGWISLFLFCLHQVDIVHFAWHKDLVSHISILALQGASPLHIVLHSQCTYKFEHDVDITIGVLVCFSDLLVGLFLFIWQVCYDMFQTYSCKAVVPNLFWAVTLISTLELANYPLRSIFQTE